jgi:hypothetical protein
MYCDGESGQGLVSVRLPEMIPRLELDDESIRVVAGARR